MSRRSTRSGIRNETHGAADGSTNRYAAKLLFQFKVVVNGNPGKRRLCQEKIILIDSVSAKTALQKAKRHGKKSELKYKNNAGDPVHFEFIGVMELMHLGVECSDGEVWYDIVQRVRPSENRDRFIPPESRLHAIALESPDT